MTESKNVKYQFPWPWHNDQIKERIRKNNYIQRIRNELKKEKLQAKFRKIGKF